MVNTTNLQNISCTIADSFGSLRQFAKKVEDHTIMTSISYIEALTSTPDNLERMLRTLPEDAVTWRPTGDSQSVIEILKHLAASEHEFVSRMHCALEGERKGISINVAKLFVARPNVSDILRHWRNDRRRLCQWLASLPPVIWEMSNANPGQAGLRREVQLMLKHDMEHVAQISHIRRAWEAEHGKGVHHA